MEEGRESCGTEGRQDHWELRMQRAKESAFEDSSIYQDVFTCSGCRDQVPPGGLTNRNFFIVVL